MIGNPSDFPFFLFPDAQAQVFATPALTGTPLGQLTHAIPAGWKEVSSGTVEVQGKDGRRGYVSMEHLRYDLEGSICNSAELLPAPLRCSVENWQSICVPGGTETWIEFDIRDERDRSITHYHYVLIGSRVTEASVNIHRKVPSKIDTLFHWCFRSISSGK